MDEQIDSIDCGKTLIYYFNLGRYVVLNYLQLNGRNCLTVAERLNGTEWNWISL